MQDKLTKKHKVTREEICQCFANRDGGFLEDTRDEHASDPPTQWFIATTNAGRELKIAFVRRSINSDPHIYIRTAYSPNAEEKRIYEKFAN